jgi:hypothetical protein
MEFLVHGPFIIGGTFVILLLAQLAFASQAAAERVIIDGVDHYSVKEPLFEPIRIVLSYKGEEYSPAYIQGISGAAFRIAGPCPCAPTSSFAFMPTEFVIFMGYEMEHLSLTDDDIVPGDEVHNIVPRVKEEIRAGRPVVVWHAFTIAEWDVVCGFDDEKKQFMGYGSYKGNENELASADETRMATCLDICPAFGAILIGDKIRKFNAREAELSALEEAIRHAHTPPAKFHEGLVCYNLWIDNFRDNPDEKVPDKPHGGDDYCLR